MNPYRHTRWYRSRRGVFFGVCRGLAEWRQLSPGLVRIVLILLCVLLRLIIPVFLAYVALAIFLPVEPDDTIEPPDWKKRFFDNE